MAEEVRGERLRELDRRIADMRARMPAHSVPPAMIIELEDLEEELSTLRSEVKHGDRVQRAI